MRRLLAFMAVLVCLFPAVALAASPTPPAHVGRPESSSSATPSTEAINRKAAANPSAYVVTNAEVILLVQNGLHTGDVLRLHLDFTPAGIENYDSYLGLMVKSSDFFVAPPVNVDFFDAYDRMMVSSLTALETKLIPEIRAAVDAKDESALGATDADWKTFKSSFAELLPALFRVQLYNDGDAATHTVSGTLALTDTFDSSFKGGQSCSGSGGYGDLALGAGVTVKDGTGAIIGTGNIVGGLAANSTECDFTFVATQVPETSFYTLVIGHRTGPAYSIADLESMDWTTQLTIGS